MDMKKSFLLFIYIISSLFIISYFDIVEVKADDGRGQTEYYNFTSGYIQSDGSVVKTTGEMSFYLPVKCGVFASNGTIIFYTLNEYGNFTWVDGEHIYVKNFKQIKDDGTVINEIDNGVLRTSGYTLDNVGLATNGFPFPIFIWEKLDENDLVDFVEGRTNLNDIDRNKFYFDTDDYTIDKETGELKQKDYKYDENIPTPQNLKLKGDLGEYTLYWKPVEGYELHVMAQEKYSYKESFISQRMYGTVPWTNVTSEGSKVFDSYSGKAPVGDSALRSKIPVEHKYIKIVEITYKARFIKEKNGRIYCGNWAIVGVDGDTGEVVTGEQDYKDDDNGYGGDSGIRYDDIVSNAKNYDFVEFIKSIPDLGSELINMATGCVDVPIALGKLIPVLPDVFINLLECAMMVSLVLAVVKWIRG